MFILVGGPAVEATKHDIRYAGPLTAITAAVVGVILNLAVFFAYHVLWPRGYTGAFEWPAALIAILSFIALFRYRAGIIKVIAACALAGLGDSLVFP